MRPRRSARHRWSHRPRTRKVGLPHFLAICGVRRQAGFALSARVVGKYGIVARLDVADRYSSRTTMPAPSWPRIAGSGVGISCCRTWHRSRRSPLRPCGRAPRLAGALQGHILHHEGSSFRSTTAARARVIVFCPRDCWECSFVRVSRTCHRRPPGSSIAREADVVSAALSSKIPILYVAVVAKAETWSCSCRNLYPLTCWT